MDWTKRKERRQRIGYNKSRRKLVEPQELREELRELIGKVMHWPEWRAWTKAGGCRNTTWFD